MAAGEWKVYYRGGGTVSSEDHSVADVPGLLDGRGVLVIKQWNPVEGSDVLLHGTGLYVVNWYWWDEEAQWWQGGDDTGMTLYLSAPGWKKILIAETAPPEEWKRTIMAAQDEYLDWGVDVHET